MINPKKDWIYFKLQKVDSIGGIVMPDNNDDVDRAKMTALVLGPDIVNIKVGDIIVVHPRSVVKHNDPDSASDVMRGFVREEDVIATVEEKSEILVKEKRLLS